MTGSNVNLLSSSNFGTMRDQKPQKFSGALHGHLGQPLISKYPYHCDSTKYCCGGVQEMRANSKVKTYAYYLLAQQCALFFSCQNFVLTMVCYVFPYLFAAENPKFPPIFAVFLWQSSFERTPHCHSCICLLNNLCRTLTCSSCLHPFVVQCWKCFTRCHSDFSGQCTLLWPLIFARSGSSVFLSVKFLKFFCIL